MGMQSSVPKKPQQSRPRGSVTATVMGWPVASGELRFSDDFVIGSDADCDLRIAGPKVAEQHVQVFFDGAVWWVRDLGSDAGSYANGNRAQVMPLSRGAELELELGRGGPRVRLAVSTDAPAQASGPPPSSDVRPTKPAAAKAPVATDTQMIEDFFHQSGAGKDGAAGREILDALKRVRKKSRRYRKLLPAAIAVVVLAIAVIGFREMKIREQEKRIANLQASAENLFYNAKSLEVQITSLEDLVLKNSDPKQVAELKQSRANLKDMESHYDEFVQKLGLYVHLAPDERIIRRVARRFGECDVNVPPDFVAAVRQHIGLIKTRNFFPAAVAKAKQKYAPVVVREFTKANLPPYFLYLALQESGFDEHAVGPGTRYGYAKGMWQFISSTAHDFGLRTGPLFEQGIYDPQDERFDWQKETGAAARYIRFLNANVTQDSSLLAMACYNWGENKVRSLVETMPENARQRNFWGVLRAKGVPAETYDYVLSIFSMSVICEDPQLFGFNVECPALGTATAANDQDPMAGG
jgi:membrane-bound lytic murein transglycosylase D